MKKILILFLAVTALVSCNNKASKADLPPSKEYAKLKGVIKNPTDSVLHILGRRYTKNILIDRDGKFDDTLKITDGVYTIIEGKNKTLVYLKNGNTTSISYDAASRDNSLDFSGDMAKTNNYLRDKMAYIKDENLYQLADLFLLDKPDFDKRVAKIQKDLQDLITNAGDIEQDILRMEMEQNQQIVDYLNMNYEKEHAQAVKFKKGNPSPKFRYPDINGKIVSLDDFKGKYVYVDVWATWCAPCKREIPFLKELNETFKGKDIVFVSLSIDKITDKGKWKKMVREKELKGVQIMADKAWESDFVKAYGIRGIPRFILIDKKGNIYDANAPRPSSPGIQKYLEEALSK